VRCWNLTRCSAIPYFGLPTHLAVSDGFAGNACVATCGPDRHVIDFRQGGGDPCKGKLVFSEVYPPGQYSDIAAVEVSKSGIFTFVSTTTGWMKVCNTFGCGKTGVIPYYSPSCMRLSPDGSFLASSDINDCSDIQIWSGQPSLPSEVSTDGFDSEVLKESASAVAAGAESNWYLPPPNHTSIVCATM